LERYYARHSQRFILPERRNLEIVMTRQEAPVRQAKREIERGADFLSIARRVSIDPEAPQGVQTLVPGQEEKELEGVVFAAKPHTLVGPVHQADDYYVLEVTKVIPRHLQDLADAAPRIRRELASGRDRTAIASRAEAADQKWRAQTKCASGYFVQSCAQDEMAEHG
jgi:parvulin-like peptidyl-prolyl isomerase